MQIYCSLHCNSSVNWFLLSVPIGTCCTPMGVQIGIHGKQRLNRYGAQWARIASNCAKINFSLKKVDEVREITNLGVCRPIEFDDSIFKSV